MGLVSSPWGPGKEPQRECSPPAWKVPRVSLGSLHEPEEGIRAAGETGAQHLSLTKEAEAREPQRCQDPILPRDLKEWPPLHYHTLEVQLSLSR